MTPLGFVVFQNPDGLNVPGAVPLAWLTARVAPRSNVTFTWTVDYSFLQSETGMLVPGVRVVPQQSVPATPGDPNRDHVQLDYMNGMFTLTTPSRGDASGQAGALQISQLANVPLGRASVGIGMSGAGTFVTPAQPNSILVFNVPPPRYWIAAGEFTPGEVLDPETITNVAEVTFADGATAMQAVLDTARRWTVGPV